MREPVSVRKIKFFLIYFLPVLVGLTFFRELGRHSLWYDELETWQTVSQVRFFDFGWEVWHKHANPPLYYFILWLLNPFLDWNETTLRFLSALSAGATVVLGFHLLKKYCGYFVALGFAFLMGSNYWIIYFSQEARPYALLIFLCMLSLFYLFKVLEEGTSSRNYRRLFIVNALVLLTHYYGAFFILSEILMLLFFSGRIEGKKRSFLLAWILFFVPIMVLFTLRDFGKSLEFLKAFELTDIEFFYDYFAEYRVAYVVFFLFLVTIVVNVFRREIFNPGHKFLFRTLFILMASMGGIYIVSRITPIFTLRYLVFLFPYKIMIFTVLISLVLENFFLVFEKNWFVECSKNIIFMVVIGLLTWGSLQQTFGVFEYDRVGKSYPYREAYEAIKKDPRYKKSSFLILEDASDKALRFYGTSDMQNKVVDLESIHMDTEEKIMLLDLGLFTEASPDMYFVKVNYKNEDNLPQYLKQPDYDKKVIFLSEKISVVRFTKKDGIF